MKTIPKASQEEGSEEVLVNQDENTLTPDKLRELSGWQVSDEEATEIIHSIKIFCRALYGIFIREQNSTDENNPVTIKPLNKAA